MNKKEMIDNIMEKFDNLIEITPYGRPLFIKILQDTLPEDKEGECNLCKRCGNNIGVQNICDDCWNGVY